MRFLSYIFLLIPILFASGETISYRLQPIDAVVPVDRTQVWDFSHIGNIGDAVTARISEHDDSVEVALPTIRYLFTRNGDTLTRHLAETRFWVLRDTVPAVVATSLRTDSMNIPVKQSGLAFHRDFIVSEGDVSLLPDVAGCLITAPDDTVRGVVLRHVIERQITALADRSGVPLSEISDSMRVSRTVESYTWILPGESFPLARTEIRSESSLGKEMWRVAETWILDDSDNETSRQKAPRQNISTHSPTDRFACLDRHAATALGYETSIMAANSLPLLLEKANVSRAPDGVQISFHPEGDMQMAHDCPVDLILTDILGRVYASGRAIDGSASLKVSDLPQGEYLLQMKRGEDIAVRKIILH